MTTMTITAEERTLRLTRLRALIEAHPEDRLHMRAFSEQAPCGTAYCAAGLAAVTPWFQEHTPILEYFEVVPTEAGLLVEARQSTYHAFFGLAAVFGLDQLDSDRLFARGVDGGTAPHAITKAEVLANIDRLLAGEYARRYRALC